MLAWCPNSLVRRLYPIRDNNSNDEKYVYASASGANVYIIVEWAAGPVNGSAMVTLFLLMSI